MRTITDRLRAMLQAVALVGTLLVWSVVGAAAEPAQSGEPSSIGDPPTITDSPRPFRPPGITLGMFGIVDGRIYRGEEPRERQYAELARLGVKTIVNLRHAPTPEVREVAERQGFRYVSIPMAVREPPTDDQVAAFIALVLDPANGPVYVFCSGGRHRTGAMIAVYRIAVNGWTAEAAFREMDAFGFYGFGGHGGFKQYVFDYYERMKTSPASVPYAYPVKPRAVPSTR